MFKPRPAQGIRTGDVVQVPERSGHEMVWDVDEIRTTADGSTFLFLLSTPYGEQGEALVPFNGDVLVDDSLTR